MGAKQESRRGRSTLEGGHVMQEHNAVAPKSAPKSRSGSRSGSRAIELSGARIGRIENSVTADRARTADGATARTRRRIEVEGEI